MVCISAVCPGRLARVREKEKEVRQEEKVGDHYTEYKNQK